MSDRTKRFRDFLFEQRFGFLLTALLFALLGEPLFGNSISGNILRFLTFMFLISSGTNLIANRKNNYFLGLLVAFLVLIPEILILLGLDTQFLRAASFFLMFLFVIFIAYELLLEVLTPKKVDFKMMIAAFSGYFMIGLLAFFTYSTLEILSPSAFNLPNRASSAESLSDMMYFTFISLTTIGYGDITPASDLAKRLVVFFGLVGQFYSVVIMAILVGKFTSTLD